MKKGQLWEVRRGSCGGPQRMKSVSLKKIVKDAEVTWGQNHPNYAKGMNRTFEAVYHSLQMTYLNNYRLDASHISYRRFLQACYLRIRLKLPFLRGRYWREKIETLEADLEQVQLDKPRRPWTFLRWAIMKEPRPESALPQPCDIGRIALVARILGDGSVTNRASSAIPLTDRDFKEHLASCLACRKAIGAEGSRGRMSD